MQCRELARPHRIWHTCVTLSRVLSVLHFAPCCSPEHGLSKITLSLEPKWLTPDGTDDERDGVTLRRYLANC